MRYLLLTIFLSFFSIPIFSQSEQTEPEELPYYEIPEAPETYSAEGVAARMIDGLGFRYYWATKDLRKEDLDYSPSETNRTSMETLRHIYGLSKTIVNAAAKKPNVRGHGNSKDDLTFEELRANTLENLKMASDLLRANGASLDDMKIIFQRGEKTSDYPFWNMINGPIADAIWHTGQIVSFRRASGNPFPAGVSVFNGKKRN